MSACLGVGFLATGGKVPLMWGEGGIGSGLSLCMLSEGCRSIKAMTVLQCAPQASLCYSAACPLTAHICRLKLNTQMALGYREMSNIFKASIFYPHLTSFNYSSILSFLNVMLL